MRDMLLPQTAMRRRCTDEELKSKERTSDRQKMHTIKRSDNLERINKKAENHFQKAACTQNQHGSLSPPPFAFSLSLYREERREASEPASAFLSLAT
mmetsp:Transcript_30288/g.59523  ORF Transcript_30288/g.59523 Transcript_30288/m.59523 type:complete len:97 (+) Transcript_30288:211-501(+)